MARKRVFWQLFPPYLLIVVFSVAAVAWYAARSMRQFYLDDTLARLEVETRLIASALEDPLKAADLPRLRAQVKLLAAQFDGRITVIAADGAVLADSHADPAQMENYAHRPEIAVALTGQEGHAVRFSNALQRELMFVALPLDVGSAQHRYVVRTALPLTMVQQAIAGLRNHLLWSALIAAILAGVVGLMLTRRLVKPLEELRANALRLAAGQLHTRIPVSDTEDFAAVAEAMNHMARELEERINTISSQRNEQDAILSSMVEGIIAVDNERRVIRLNRAAAAMLRLEPEKVPGQSIQAVVRHAELLRLIDATFSQGGKVEGEIQLSNDSGTAIHCRGTLLRALDGSRLGVVMALNDITRLKHLETLRRDFVANVSHELKTPLTSIKGYVETLRDGALSDSDNAARFLDIILRQTDHLNNLITDLLSLSRIERETERGQVAFSPHSLGDILERAVHARQQEAEARNIAISIDGATDKITEVNAVLLEQAVVNLLDNAVKYSEPGGRVTLSVRSGPEEIIIEVTDNGPGIPDEHRDRLFERFYRVDAARSRQIGGTGLGLAIVKHIAIAHGGTVSVSSRVGKGSTFCIHLPHRQL